MNMKFVVFGIILAMILASCSSSNNSTNSLPNKSIEGVYDLVPPGWDVEKGNSSIRITSKQTCTREVMIKPNPAPVNETINLEITLNYVPRWTEEDYAKEKQRYDDCVEQITNNPQLAMGCSDKSPDLNTLSHSIFLSQNDCNGESDELYNSISSYFAE